MVTLFSNPLSNSLTTGLHVNTDVKAWSVTQAGSPDTVTACTVKLSVSGIGTIGMQIADAPSTGRTVLATAQNTFVINDIPGSESGVDAELTFRFNNESLFGYSTVWLIFYFTAHSTATVDFYTQFPGVENGWTATETSIGDISTAASWAPYVSSQTITCILQGIVTTVDNTNNTVVSTVTWGTGGAVTLAVNAQVQSGGILTLDIPDLDSFVGDGYYLEVQPGGSLTLGDETVVVADGYLYRVLGRS